MTRTKPVTDDTQRAARRAHLTRLRALSALTSSERSLLRRLLDIEAGDPVQGDEGDLRRLLGIHATDDDERGPR